MCVCVCEREIESEKVRRNVERDKVRFRVAVDW